MWLRKKTKPIQQYYPVTPQVYPAGTAVVTSEGRYFINKDGKRYRITTDAIWDSWKFPLTVYTSEPALQGYPIALSRLGFRDGSLLNNIADGKLYVVSGGVLRHIVDPLVFTRLGVSQQDAVVVSDAEINIMKQGEAIS